jgi:hypothetical protein
MGTLHAAAGDLKISKRIAKAMNLVHPTGAFVVAQSPCVRGLIQAYVLALDQLFVHLGLGLGVATDLGG